MIENKDIEKQNIENKSKAVLVFQIITAILYGVLAFFLIYTFFEAVIFANGGEGNSSLGIALYLVFFVIIFGGIGAVVNALVSIAGLIIALFKKKKGFLVSKGKIAYFIVFIVLPVLTVFALGIITKLMV